MSSCQSSQFMRMKNISCDQKPYCRFFKKIHLFNAALLTVESIYTKKNINNKKSERVRKDHFSSTVRQHGVWEYGSFFTLI